MGMEDNLLPDKEAGSGLFDDFAGAVDEIEGEDGLCGLRLVQRDLARVIGKDCAVGAEPLFDRNGIELLRAGVFFHHPFEAIFEEDDAGVGLESGDARFAEVDARVVGCETDGGARSVLSPFCRSVWRTQITAANETIIIKARNQNCSFINLLIAEMARSGKRHL